MRFLITSDWQTQNSNIDFCRRAHDQEMKILKTQDIQGHIDCGDRKQDYSPIAWPVIDFQMDRHEAIIKAVGKDNSIILMGNHDRISQNADDRNWFTLFRRLGGHVVSTPRLVEYEDVVFACLPYIHDIKQQKSSARDLHRQAGGLDKTKVLLFHLDVASAKYSHVSTTPSEAKLTANDLYAGSYKRSFGGHIHLRQHIIPNIMYIGNPFACDWGEIDQRKCFIVWDSETDTIKLIDSVVPGMYSLGYVHSHPAVKIAEGSKIKDFVDCSLNEDYHNELANHAARIEKLYPGSIPYVLPRFTSEESDKVEVDIDASDSEKIKRYLEATVSKELNADALFSYMDYVLTSVAGYSLHRNIGKLRFLSVEAENVLSYHKVSLDYRKLGTTIIQGINKDWKRSNGAGKSNLVSLLVIALFGRTFKGQKNDGWANQHKPGKAFVKLTMQDDNGRKITVIRQRRPVKLQLLINDVDASEGLRQSGKKETQGLIEEATGLTFETLANSVYIDSAITNSFLTGTDAERSALISRFQNLDRFKTAKDYVAKDIHRHNALVANIGFEQDHASSMLVEKEQQLKEQLKTAKSNTEQVEQELNRALAVLRVRDRKLALPVHTLEESIDSLTARYNEGDREVQKQAKVTWKLTDGIKAIQDEIKKINDSSDTNCSVCKRPITKEVRMEILEGLAKKEKELRGDYGEATRVLRSLEKVQETRWSKLKKKKAALEEYGNELAALKSKVTIAQVAHDTVADMQERDESKIEQIRVDIAREKNKIASCKEAMKEAAEQLAFLNYAHKAFSKEGLPRFLNNLIVPKLNKAADAYAKIFCDSEIQVVFNLKDDAISPQVINLHGSGKIKDQSGGEGAFAGLITAFALRETAAPTNLLILDEPGAGMDAISARQFGDKLRHLDRHFESVLIITHHQALEAALGDCRRLTIIKKNRVSKLRSA